ncbi:MAG: hypothetical protein IIC81_07750 [Chloroflexi bacterium]|nr:hypothetical protein [Chloroflexota bacterium]
MHTTLPELLWIDILNSELGEQRTLEILEAMLREVNQRMSDKKHWGCFASSYSLLSVQCKAELLDKLKIGNFLADIQSALKDFLRFYPKCPLQFFAPHSKDDSENRIFLQSFKDRISELTNKRSRAAIIMQANAIYTASNLGWLKVQRGSPMAERQAICLFFI